MSRAPTPVETVLHRWKAEVETRRARTKQDPIADAISSCAADLEEAISSDTRTELTVDEYCAKHRRSPATVRRWCRTKALISRSAGRGYLIPVDAVPPDFTRDHAA